MLHRIRTSTTGRRQLAAQPRPARTRRPLGPLWNRGMLLLALLALAAPGGAWAQVAVPRLVPAGPSIFDPSSVPHAAGVVPLNPAALQWASPSMAGGGGARTDSTWTAPTPAEPTFHSFYGGGRWVGESFSIGAETVQLEDVEDNLEVRASTNRAAAATQFGDMLALGLGYTSASVLHAQFTTDNVSDTVIVQEAGISLRLAESWFLGGSIGREARSRTTIHFSDAEWEVERDVAQYAIGYRQGGSVLLHVEVGAVEHAEAIAENGAIVTGHVAQYGTIELNVYNILLGYLVTNITVPRQERTAVMTQADIGWVPASGIAITARQERLVEHSEARMPGGTLVPLEYEHVTNSITVSINFF